jgi:DNA-binding transcriptional MocR family regulator
MKLEPAILDVLFPSVQAQILRSLFGASKTQRHVRELMRETNLALSTVQDELRKLNAVGLLTTRSNGYHRFYHANGGHPLFHEIRRIVAMSERLPRTKRSALLRTERSNRRKKHRGPRRASGLRADRTGVSWNLFSRRGKT